MHRIVYLHFDPKTETRTLIILIKCIKTLLRKFNCDFNNVVSNIVIVFWVVISKGFLYVFKFVTISK